MSHHADSRISHQRAAQLLYRTRKPSLSQVERVREWIATGEMGGDSRGTTTSAVAEFASKSALHKQDVASQHPSVSRPQRNSSAAREVYQDTLKQYFLAVFLKRKTHDASKLFKRAVLAGQITFLCAVALLVVFTARWAFPPLSEERAAAVAWLEANTDRYRIVQFHPTSYDENGNAQLWIEYHYSTPQGRGVDTKRVFTVANGQVIAVDSE